MDTYTLIDLLLFLREQQKNNYHNIDVLIEIFNRKDIPPMRKRALILTGLRHLDLQECYVFEDKVLARRIDDGTILCDFDWTELDITIPMGIFDCRLINAGVQFKNIMN